MIFKTVCVSSKMLVSRFLESASSDTHWSRQSRPMGNKSVPKIIINVNGKGSPYSNTERRVLELIPVLGSQPAGDVSHKPGGRLPLLSARPAVTITTLKRAATNFTAR